MTTARNTSNLKWIRTLAAPYLRGYRAQRRQDGLDGFYFLAHVVTGKRQSARSKPCEAGFFVGYIRDASDVACLKPQPPECVVFAFVTPPQSPLYRRLVAPQEGLFPRTFNYIRWLTHRPPRFVFHPDQECVLTRHRSMADWPAEKHEHYSRNFFIETLAWLVRSGLVRKLAEEAASSKTAPGRVRKKTAARRRQRSRRP